MTARVPARAKVIFLADAGRAVGGGHVMRCLTLAAALDRLGAECAFAATHEARAILDAFADPRIRRFAAPSSDLDVLVSFAAEAAQTWGADFAVIDHYQASAADDARMRAAAGRLLALEDLRRRRVCDLLVDSNLGRSVSDYGDVQALVGPNFALVRPEFAAGRSAAIARRRAGQATALLVSLGLTDVGAVTGRVVNALRPVLGTHRAIVVVGAGAPSLPALSTLAQSDTRIELHIETNAMAELIARADIAVGAGGSSAWERCVLGLPSVSLILADNQRENTLALAAAGATLAIEVNSRLDEAVATAASGLLGDDQARRAMGDAAAGLCDGLGAERVAARMLALIKP
jgi:UDP-2,4-diacetamido-2,4,6-trideoxy-beta-L-altropyranose hydrolase